MVGQQARASGAVSNGKNAGYCHITHLIPNQPHALVASSPVGSAIDDFSFRLEGGEV